MKITEKEFNAITGEETITEREETSSEKKVREKAEEKFKELQAAEADRASKRQAILDRLGLTSEEAALLLS